jgi:hypothetical protein
MLITFWIVVAMVGFLWVPNTRYAVKEYLRSRNKLIFTVYMVLLIGLGYMLVAITTQLISLAQASQDVLNSQ